MNEPKPSQLLVGSIHLAAVPTAVRCARMFAAHWLERWGLDAVADDVIAILSELVTNAVEATGITEPNLHYADLERLAIVGVQLRVTGQRLFVEIWDCSPELPMHHNPDANSERGRGMGIVQTLSHRQGVAHPTTGGKVVWAELRLPHEGQLPSVGATAGLPKRLRSEMPPNWMMARHEASAALLGRVLEGMRRL